MADDAGASRAIHFLATVALLAYLISRRAATQSWR